MSLDCCRVVLKEILNEIEVYLMEYYLTVPDFESIFETTTCRRRMYPRYDVRFKFFHL